MDAGADGDFTVRVTSCNHCPHPDSPEEVFHPGGQVQHSATGRFREPTMLDIEAAERNGWVGIEAARAGYFVPSDGLRSFGVTGEEFLYGRRQDKTVGVNYMTQWAARDREMQIAAGGDPVDANFVDLDPRAIRRVAEVMGEGSRKYGDNLNPNGTWQQIEVLAHINHALNHLFNYLAGDMSEDHLGHAACRVLGALGKALRDAPTSE